MERVNKRDQDTPEQRTLRLLNAEREMAEAPSSDYLIINRQDHLPDAAERLKAIMLAEHSRTAPRQPEVSSLDAKRRDTGVALVAASR